jgi:prepilin-type processing-associated H-X9-DG protein
VIAIIGLLIALLLPAVQAARESARRTQCVNNLKQIGVGLHNYHDSKKSFPEGCLGDGVVPATSWHVLTMPYMEQDALFEEYLKNPTTGLPSAQLTFANATAREVTRRVVNTLLCPTDGSANPTQNENRRFLTSLPAGFFVSKSNYVGNGGNAGNTGLFGEVTGTAKPVKANDVLDGLSNTFAAGERSTLSPKKDAAGIQIYNYAGIWAGMSDETNPGTPTDLVNSYALWGYTLYKMQDGLAVTTTPVPWQAFSSLHPGGANFLMADGSVRFIKETIVWTESGSTAGLATYNRLGDRKDGLAVSDF